MTTEQKNRELVIFNARFSYRYYLDGKEVCLENLIVENADKLGISIVREGNGTKLGRGENDRWTEEP